MDKYEIEGSYPLKGKIKASGNKNAALPCLAAALLTDEEVILENIPEIEDVSVMVRILKQLGSKVTWLGTNKYSIKTTDIKKAEIPAAEAKAIRASILFAGPLLARTGSVTFPPPGGDVIGHRRLDTHFLAFSELGARVSSDGVYKVTANKLVGVDLFLDEASVTATENAIMTAVLAEGQTVIQNAASEPHVQDLCNMLVSMGAKIEGIGSNILRIKGVTKLHGTQFRIGSDFMEVGSYIGLAAVTHSKLEIIDAEPKNLRMAKIAFGKLGINWETSGNSILVRPRQELRVKLDMGDQIPENRQQHRRDHHHFRPQGQELIKGKEQARRDDQDHQGKPGNIHRDIRPHFARHGVLYRVQHPLSALHGHKPHRQQGIPCIFRRCLGQQRLFRVGGGVSQLVILQGRQRIFQPFRIASDRA